MHVPRRVPLLSRVRTFRGAVKQCGNEGIARGLPLCVAQAAVLRYKRRQCVGRSAYQAEVHRFFWRWQRRAQRQRREGSEAR